MKEKINRENMLSFFWSNDKDDDDDDDDDDLDVFINCACDDNKLTNRESVVESRSGLEFINVCHIGMISTEKRKNIMLWVFSS